jgi:nascent polypeptide-associated complex subunit alpha
MKINPKQLEKMARKMGIETEGIEATEVIIKTPGKDIIISNPQVSRVNMMGQDSWQIAGEVSERSSEPFTDDDVKLVIAQTGSTETDARAALQESGGDLAGAIMKLKK